MATERREWAAEHGLAIGDLRELIPGSEVRGPASVRVTGVRHDSREVAPGDAFACLVGGSFDGYRFAADAIARGAVALIGEGGRAGDLPPNVPVLFVPDGRAALAAASAAVYGYPSRAMRVVAATGTNGKSTTIAMVTAMAEAAGLATGRIGTLGAESMGRELPCAHTTPEADDLQRLLAQMRDMGARLVAMEASSHGLALRRTDYTAFAAGIFTNLTQDHLDYHSTLDEYFAAKLRLFAEYPRWSVGEFAASVNLDDPRGSDVAKAVRGRTITFGLHRDADIRARDVVARAGSTSFTTEGAAGRLRIELPIGGSFQVANALGAIGAAFGLGLPSSAVVEGLASMRPVPGRFEAIETGRGWDLIVDFAHTPDGLQALIASARALAPRKLIVLFGCGGNRDRGKRPIMGAIAGRGADTVVVTSDNPRHEDPDAIIGDIMLGLKDTPARVLVNPDRRTATRMALDEARAGDLVLLAGKGGETHIIVGDERIPYDDRLVAREILAAMP